MRPKEWMIQVVLDYKTRLKRELMSKKEYKFFLKLAIVRYKQKLNLRRSYHENS